MFKSVGVVILLVAVAYVFAIGTYFLLPAQPTDASFVDGAIKITGPIAAFVIVFLILASVFNRIFRDSRALPSVLDPGAKDLVGIWDVVSVSYGASKEERRSLAEVQVSSHRLTMKGGGLQRIEGGATRDTGQWHCEAVFFENGRLVYLYEMDDRSFPNEPKTRGVVEAQVQPGVRPMKLQGTWSTFGGNSHSGTIALTKRS